MINTLNNKTPLNGHNKVQYKLIVLISTLYYLNNKNQKYTQKNILYYFNENLKKWSSYLYAKNYSKISLQIKQRNKSHNKLLSTYGSKLWDGNLL
ncbi:hypothetical protein HNQ06_000948 [Borrelia lanei]|uniref:Uncharacterized protein n=1 Tax=Borreliella lanei TaxID=373540 RepID=A0A7W9ZEA0_9SPIR|nr:hypothetical protein [Borreliella lanei]MBB6208418.1 hypothetical protein [Borreliella lanei]